MTVEEKAKELVDKFKEYTEDKYAEHWSDAKACALICVDEIIEVLNQIHKPEYTIFIADYTNVVEENAYEKIEYYQQVKEELQKL